ncbi:MAG TPA: tetraacyldisaccharide 4'-kinase [Epsilonproteobacteria bacterium]|nr:tetraacyldisaccharide 4'-kinase [Campylobacterota bacterium]
MRQFVEDMWYKPRWYHWAVSLIFLPLSVIWATVMMARRFLATPKNFSIPIVSVGNLQVGGTGKTPFVIALASKFRDAWVVSRGYGRDSKGLVWVSDKGKILASVKTSGDEAYLIASMLKEHSVVVSEDRVSGIEFAKQKGAKVILLDDGFSQVAIDKLEILLFPNTIPNRLPMPSGPYREWWWLAKKGHIVAIEQRDFQREVTFDNLTSRMVLVTAIANPQRLDKYLPQGVVAKYYLPDHAYFNKEHLLSLLSEYRATSLLVTQKDSVKIEDFKLPISVIKLKLNLKKKLLDEVENYIKGYTK